MHLIDMVEMLFMSIFLKVLLSRLYRLKVNTIMSARGATLSGV